MKKFLPLFTLLFTLAAFAEEALVTTDMQPTIEIIVQNVPTESDIKEITPTTENNAQTIEQIQIIQNEKDTAEPDKQTITPAQIIETVTITQGCIDSIVSVVENAAEEVQDIAEYVDDACDAYLNNNDNGQTTDQTPSEVAKIQILCATLIALLQQKGFTNEQIVELFEAITKLKDQNLTANQSERPFDKLPGFA